MVRNWRQLVNEGVRGRGEMGSSLREMEIKDWFPKCLSLVLNWILINPFPVTKLSVDHL